MSLIDYSVSDGLCVLRLNAPPVNAITVALLEELRSAISRAHADAAVRGIVVTSGGRLFSAGADVNLFREFATAQDGIEFSRAFQDALCELEDSVKPVAAAMSGKVLGGALELAAACHFRVCSEGTRFSMPEVELGINPAGGGTQRLPRLIGPLPALKMMLTAEDVGAEDALTLGLVDAVCGHAELLDIARTLLESAAEARKTRDRTDRVGHAAANREALAAAERLSARIHPEVIARTTIAEAVKVGLSESFEAGQRKEQEGFAACLNTPATRNKIKIFFAVRATARMPGVDLGQCPEVARAAVIGMGSMGTGIAHALIIAGIPVTVHDVSDAAIDKGLGRIHRSVGKRVEQGKCSRRRADDMLSLITRTTRWEDLAEADLVIEAVFEDVPAKQAVISAVEGTCRRDTLVASNTSTISLDVLAAGMRHPERLVGMHFFNPAHRMPLVEVIRCNATAPAVAAAALKFVKTLRKTPVLVRNREGFAVNRIFIPYLKEAFRLLEDGAEPMLVDDAMVRFGFPMGPFAVIDMAGIDILVVTDGILSAAFPRQGHVSPIAAELVERGHLGQKTGCGVYRYEKGSRRPQTSEGTGQIVEELRRRSGRSPREIGADQIIERLVLGMVNEAWYVLEEGIVASESDIDVATVLGMGFPDFRGGVLTYARELGLDAVRARLTRLEETHGERFSPCRQLGSA